MTAAEVTDEQIQNSNEPDFKAALGERDKLKEHSDKAPDGYRKQEQDVLAKAHGGAEQAEAAQLAGMHGARTGALGKAEGHKQGAKGQDEAKRAKVASDIQGIYARTKSDVTRTLDGLEGKVDKAFSEGEGAARRRFEDTVSKRMDAYKDERYSGLIGKGRWLKDKLMGLPGEVNQFYADGRTRYLSDMDGVIGKVADVVGAELTAARARIAAGKAEVHQYVTALPKDLREVGKEAESSLQSQFDQLSSDVDAKQDELVDTLARKYVEARDALDARIDEMKAANRGLVDKALDAIGSVIKTIIQLKTMLMSILAKAADVIGDIIKDPIGFLGKLIDGIKSGLNRFVGNIASHLQEGLMGWLFGALGGAGITIPKTFDLSGIVDLVLQVLGLTYQNIRSRAVRLIGEPAMQRMEQTVDVFKTLVSEGVGGLWRFIKDRVGDLEDLVLGSIKTFIIEKVIKAGVVWLIAFLNPAAAFIKACKMIVDVISFLIERGSEIMSFVSSILDSVGAIAKGAIGGVAEKVESSLAKALPLAISFLAGLLGLGGISEQIHQVIDKVRAPINKAVDFVVMGAVKGARKLFGRVRDKVKGAKDWVKGKARKAFQAGLPEDPNERLQAGKAAALSAVRAFAGRRVGGQVLRPLLRGIRLRYGFERLDVVPRGGEWAVAGKINPEFDEPSGVLTPEDLKPEADDGRTLEVGGGNFSFAVSVASKTMLGSRLVATNFEVSDRKSLKKTAKEQERDAVTRQNMSILASMGVEVVEQVDATDPASYPEGEFDIVVFNHPYVSGKTEDGKPTRGGEGENRKMLAGFLETAKGKIREGGKITIISSRFRLQRWKLDKLAESLDLDMLVKEFEPADWEGYEHEKTRNADAAETVRRTEQFAIILTVKAEKKDG